MNPSLNGKYLPDPITEAVIEPKLKWSRRSILRQARLTDFKTPTAYLLQTPQLTTKGALALFGNDLKLARNGHNQYPTTRIAPSTGK